MSKPFSIVLALIFTIAISYSFTKHDDPEYKNLKILPKNISEHELDSIMRHFNGAMGQKCNFCHVRNDSTKTMDWASDKNKHKLIAREMMTMTLKINDKYFEYANKKPSFTTNLMVTCYTCHNGRPEPLTKVPRPQPRPASDTINRIDSTRRN